MECGALPTLDNTISQPMVATTHTIPTAITCGTAQLICSSSVLEQVEVLGCTLSSYDQ